MEAIIFPERFRLLHGIPVHINDTKVRRPVREVRRGRWHQGRCYADRIDKKWLKRYGTEVGPMIRDGQVLTMAMPIMWPFKPDSVRRALVMNSTTYLRLVDKLGSPDGADALAYAAQALQRGPLHG